MEQILAEEAFIEARLQALEDQRRSLGPRLIDLRSIKVPGDLAQFHASLHRQAVQRNADLLQDLDIATGKLHTQTLFPMQQKLLALRQAYLALPVARNPKF